MHGQHRAGELRGRVLTFTRKGIGTLMLVSTPPSSGNLGSISGIIQNRKVSVGNAAFSFFSVYFVSLRKSILRAASTNSSLDSSIPFIVSCCFLAVGWLGKEIPLVWIFGVFSYQKKKQICKTLYKVLKVWECSYRFRKSRDLCSSLGFYHSLVLGYWTIKLILSELSFNIRIMTEL